MQQMSSGLEGHMLPGLLWEARQPVIEFNTSRFSPQLPRSRSLLEIISCHFLFSDSFSRSDPRSVGATSALLQALFDFREANAGANS